jgi:hypothetical protein
MGADKKGWNTDVLEKITGGAERLLLGGYPFTPVDRKFVNWLAALEDKKEGTKKPLFNRLFGPDPSVGDSVTLMEVYEKTGLGYPQMLPYLKKWKEKYGVEVEYGEKEGKGMRVFSTFTIVRLRPPST